VHHPQVLDFATAKSDLTQITGANISIRLTDEFLQAVQDNLDYELRWPVEDDDGFRNIIPKISKWVNAREVWNEIIKQAHSTGEPGLLFWDAIRRESPADCYSKFGFRTVSTNPCSELPLCALDSCRLLLLNLFGYVREPFTPKAYFDFDAFYEDAQIAQRFMDDIVDLELECIEKIIAKVESDPEEEDLKAEELSLWKKIRKMCKEGRRTGTGITALGDTLAALGIQYGSRKGVNMTDKIYRTLKLGCYRSSVDMAKELGPFSVWSHELEENNPLLLRIQEEDPELYEDMKVFGRRNIALLTTAPAGSVSIECRTTSGIEPVYQAVYIRKKKVNPNDSNAVIHEVDANGDAWQHFQVYHPKLQMWMDITGKTNTDKSPYKGSEAEDIHWKDRIEMQAAATKHVDHAISSTINLASDVEPSLVSEIYKAAWKSGCKGITVYRDGARDGVLVRKSDKDTGICQTIQKNHAEKRPKRLPCEIHHATVKGESYFILVGIMGGDPYEVFAGKNGKIPKAVKTGVIKKVKRGLYRAELEKDHVIESIVDIENEEEEAMTRMISTALRHGADISFIVHQLEKTKGDMYCFAKSIARTLKKYIPDGTTVTGEACGECGNQLVRECGCKICKNCGYSACQ